MKAKKRTKKPLDALDDGLTISPASMKVLKAFNDICTVYTVMIVVVVGPRRSGSKVYV